MKIRIIRGTHQIGGTITEISTENTRILIDIGAELPQANQEQATAFDIEGATTGKPSYDAIFVTHYHGDHIGMFANVLPSIPIYMGKTAKQIFRVIQQTLDNFGIAANPDLVDKFVDYQAGKPIQLADIKITPYCIDHSAYDAYMLFIEAQGKRILHTGDFRMHGARGKKMPLVFEKFAKDIDILICEGTMLSRMSDEVLTEHQLGSMAKQYLQSNKNVFVLLSSTNIDTIAEFFNAAIKTKRPFVVCDKMQADILNIVSSSAKSSFYDFSRQKVYTYGKQLHKYMSDCGFCFIGRANSKTMRAIEQFPNNLLIYSMWTGYLDKNHCAFDQYKYQWINQAITLGSKRIDLHTSGHATAEQIEQVCRQTNAKTIIPIHTERPQCFKELSINGQLRFLNDGEIAEF